MVELFKIQNEVNAPKGNYNSFGKYKYRSAEDILMAAKPICAKYECALIVSDNIVEIGQPYQYHTNNGKGATSQYNGTRIYVEATATLINKDGESISVKGYAREDIVKAGMDVSQITGAASSYARKYALNGLLAIDDGTDADRLNVTKEYTAPQNFPPQVDNSGMVDNTLNEAVAALNAARTIDELKAVCSQYPQYKTNEYFASVGKQRKTAILQG